jgi:hypothetical protein
MILVGDKLISEDILEKEFVCDLAACKGVCCVEGDAGAPLEDFEIGIMEEELNHVLPFLPESGKRALKKEGSFTIDGDGDLVTPLVDGKHCAYTVFDEQGIAGCGIEKAWLAGKSKFRKPISCHLYPIRVQKLVDQDALNYHKWDVCAPACACGTQLKVPVYAFLKEALIRAYGETWYAILDETAAAWLKK